jgi:hypothetical protein
MAVTDLGAGAVGLTNLACTNIAWYVPSGGATGQPVISQIPGRTNPSSSCSFAMPVQDSVAQAAGNNVAVFQFSLDSTHRAMHGIGNI